jgi:MoaA/NifB/PqqE/SkfB family radical SAM enzyme
LSIESPTFCVYPWVHQTVLPMGTISYCCVAQDGGSVVDGERRQKVPKVSLADAWNSPFYRELRRKMLAGEPVEGCKLCYFQEGVGKDSYRQMHNREWLSLEGPRLKEEINASSANGYHVKKGPLYLDLRLGNLCNLRCRMCNPYNSSRLESETRRLLDSDPSYAALFRKYYGDKLYPIPAWYDDPLFWEAVHAQLPDLRKIYVTGGEPTIIKKNIEFLRHCVETGHASHISLLLSVNCTGFTDEFLALLGEFESVLINASLDGCGEVNEYVRGGSRWEKVSESFRQLLRLPVKIQVGVTPTVQIYNVLHLVDLLRFVEDSAGERQISMDFLYVTKPPYFDVRILPAAVKRAALERLDDYLAGSASFVARATNLRNSIDSLRNVLSAEGGESAALAEEFAQVTRSFDSSRGESFRRSLPELSSRLAAEGWNI